MKKVLEMIVKNIVDTPEDVIVEEKLSNNTTILKIKVADSDMGKVIGKGGKVAKAIRTVMTAAAIKANDKVIVDIVD